jgi:hypothetical protein
MFTILTSDSGDFSRIVRVGPPAEGAAAAAGGGGGGNPAGTGAFYFYAEPNAFGTFNITATSGGVPVAQLTEGNSGANYFGFYGTGGDTFSSIIVTFDQGAGGGAVGEFGIAASGASGVPDGGSSVAFFGRAVLALTSLRRRLG